MNRLLAALLGSALFVFVPLAAAEGDKGPTKPSPCDDPIAGTWHAVLFSTRSSQWTTFDLTIHRAAPGSANVTGSILGHLWRGDAKKPTPGPCVGQTDYFVTESAAGTFDGATLVFDTTAIVGKKVVCGTENRWWPDHFKGPVDVATHEFRSLNNDGHDSVDQVTTFRRTSCD